MAEALRRALDQGLGIADGRAARLAAVDEPAGALADDESWQAFLDRARRPGGADDRLRSLHQGIDIVGYVIAATSEVLGAGLLTLNVEHFPMLEGLRPPF